MCKEGICQNLNFGVSEVEKVKFGSAEQIGCKCRNISVSQKAQMFGERSILMKCSILYGCLRGNIQFLIFENVYIVFRWGKVWVKSYFS